MTHTRVLARPDEVKVGVSRSQVPRLSFAASVNARKSRSRVMRGMPWSIQLWAIKASPRRALRRVASTLARNAPPLPIARCDVDQSTSEIVSTTSEGSFGSLKSSVSTTGTITSWRSAKARSSNCTSSPLLPSRKAIQLLVSAAITGRPSAPPACARSEPCLGVSASEHKSARRQPAVGQCVRSG